MDFDSLAKRPLSDLIVINLNSKFRIWWGILETWCQLTSSYLYAYMAAFEDVDTGILLTINYVLEGIFGLSLIFKFFYEYKRDESE